MTNMVSMSNSSASTMACLFSSITGVVTLQKSFSRAKRSTVLRASGLAIKGTSFSRENASAVHSTGSSAVRSRISG